MALYFPLPLRSGSCDFSAYSIKKGLNLFIYFPQFPCFSCYESLIFMGFEVVGQAPGNVEESNVLSSARMRTREKKKQGSFICDTAPFLFFFFFFPLFFFLLFLRIQFWIFGISFGIKEQHGGGRREVVLQMVFSTISLQAIVPNAVADTGNLEFSKKEL